jgi:restriction system protein
MLIIYAITLFFSWILCELSVMLFELFYCAKISILVDKISCKDDLLYLRVKEYEYVIAEIFRRSGYKVRLSDHFGEGGTGIILNDLYYVLPRKECYHHHVEVELAKKLNHHMKNNSIYRGMIVTLGDFKINTKKFCYTNVINCINGNQLMQMCKDVKGTGLDTIFAKPQN